ncbi:MAG TPA: anti-sigma factor antagonist [Solirubrobacteraceae bacterium]
MDAGPSLRIRIAHDGDECTVTVAGDVDLATSTQLKRALDEALDGEPAAATIRADLGGVGFLDTTGLGLLLAARTRALGRGSRFIVTSTSAELDRLFDITGVATYLRGD